MNSCQGKIIPTSDRRIAVQPGRHQRAARNAICGSHPSVGPHSLPGMYDVDTFAPTLIKETRVKKQRIALHRPRGARDRHRAAVGECADAEGQAGSLHVAARARRDADDGRLQASVSGHRSRGVPFRHDRGHGQAGRRIRRRPTQGRRAADRRCRQHGGAEKRRSPVALSGSESGRLRARRLSMPTRPISAPS